MTVTEAPLWLTAAVAALMLVFGVFIGYAIAAYEDLRRIEREQTADEISTKEDNRGLAS